MGVTATVQKIGRRYYEHECCADDGSEVLLWKGLQVGKGSQFGLFAPFSVTTSTGELQFSSSLWKFGGGNMLRNKDKVGKWRISGRGYHINLDEVEVEVRQWTISAGKWGLASGGFHCRAFTSGVELARFNVHDHREEGEDAGSAEISAEPPPWIWHVHGMVHIHSVYRLES